MQLFLIIVPTSIPHRKPLLLSPAPSAPSQAPAPLDPQARYVKAAAARGQNACDSCNFDTANSTIRQLNFRLRRPVSPRGVLLFCCCGIETSLSWYVAFFVGPDAVRATSAASFLVLATSAACSTIAPSFISAISPAASFVPAAPTVSSRDSAVLAAYLSRVSDLLARSSLHSLAAAGSSLPDGPSPALVQRLVC